jgi:hypothetical protein
VVMVQPRVDLNMPSCRCLAETVLTACPSKGPGSPVERSSGVVGEIYGPESERPSSCLPGALNAFLVLEAAERATLDLVGRSVSRSASKPPVSVPPAVPPRVCARTWARLTCVYMHTKKFFLLSNTLT